MAEQKDLEKELALEKIITGAVKIPGVKVNRKSFLKETFAETEYPIDKILEEGPIAVGVKQEELQKISTKLIFNRTTKSSLASFAAGIPGGLAMAATIPADILQFFGMALKLAQELSYVYGQDDLWQNGQIDEEAVKNNLVVYCGVMFGVSGAVSGLRVLSTQLAKTALKKIPQKALTKTFWYPIIKQIGKALSIKVTKTTLANGVSKAIPIIGGVISGSLNFASMMPMANRLQKAFESANFGYTDEAFEADFKVVETGEALPEEDNSLMGKAKNTFNSLKDKFTKRDNVQTQNQIVANEPKESKEDIINTIKELKELLDMGIITEEEFNTKKTDLLSKI